MILVLHYALFSSRIYNSMKKIANLKGIKYGNN